MMSIWGKGGETVTIEYKVGIAEFYLYMGLGADLLKSVVAIVWKLPKSESAHL